MKQTAVEWLFDQLEFDESILFYNIKDIFDKAKEIEKQQIIEAGNSRALKQHLHSNKIYETKSKKRGRENRS